MFCNSEYNSFREGDILDRFHWVPENDHADTLLCDSVPTNAHGTLVRIASVLKCIGRLLAVAVAEDNFFQSLNGDASRMTCCLAMT